MSINCIQLLKVGRETNSKEYWHDRELKRFVKKAEAVKVRGGGFNCLNICREKMQNKRGKKRSFLVQAVYCWHEIHVWQGLLFQNKRFPFEKRGLVCVFGEESDFTMRKDTENPLPGYLPLFYCNDSETSPTLLLKFVTLPCAPPKAWLAFDSPAWFNCLFFPWESS